MSSIPTGYGGLGGYAPTAFYPGQITPVQPAQPQPIQALTGGSGGGGGGYPPGFWEGIQASNAADQAAQIVYSEWMMRHGDEQLALQKAQQAWTETYQTATLTGTLNGQQTLPAQQQYWSQQFNQQQLGQQGALALLGLQAGMQGPRDVFRYHQLNANTPQGLKDILAGLAGQYGFAGSGYQGTPGAATLQSRAADLLGGAQGGAPLTLPAPLPGPLPAPAPAPPAAPSQAAAAGPGAQAVVTTPEYGQPIPPREAPYDAWMGLYPPQPTTPRTPQTDLLAGGQLGAAGAQGQAGQPSAGASGYALPSPNQIDVANWWRLSPSAQQTALGAYESQGYYGADVEEAIRRAAPRYTYGGGQAQMSI